MAYLGFVNNQLKVNKQLTLSKIMNLPTKQLSNTSVRSFLNASASNNQMSSSGNVSGFFKIPKKLEGCASHDH